MATLPSLFFVRAKVREDPHPGEERYCLVSARSIESPGNGRLWKLEIVDGSKYIVQGAVMRHDGLEGPAEEFWHERDTRLDPSGVFYYENKMWRMKTYLSIPGQGQVWQYAMTRANRILPSKFNHVGHCRDRCKKWHFTLDDLIVPVDPAAAAAPTLTPAAIGKLPVHVFHAYVEHAISKREECPITMDPLRKETVGCLPCGHLFEKKAIERALESNGVCPTCRAAATKQDIQVW